MGCDQIAAIIAIGFVTMANTGSEVNSFQAKTYNIATGSVEH